MARIPFSVHQIARAIWTYLGGAAGTTADRAVNTSFWNGTAVTAPNTAGTPVVDATRWLGTTIAAADTAGYPKVTIKNGSGTGEIALVSGKVDVNDKTGFSLTAGSYVVRASSVSRGLISITVTEGTTNTAGISSVTMTRAIEGFTGFDTNTNTVVQATRIALTATNTVTATRNAAANNAAASFTVFELF